MPQSLRRWIPFCLAIVGLGCVFATIVGFAELSYGTFDRDAEDATARARREPRFAAWLERFAAPPTRDLVPHWKRLVDVHRPDHWTEDTWGYDRDPNADSGTTYVIDGEFAHVAYDPIRRVVVSRFYNKYKTPEGTLVRTAPKPPIPIPEADSSGMRSVSGLRVGDAAAALARSGYADRGTATLYHLPGPCRKSNPCAVLLYVEIVRGRIAMLDFFRRYYYGDDHGPAAPVPEPGLDAP